MASQHEAVGQRTSVSRRLPFAGGWVGLAVDGSVAAVEHPAGRRSLLLNEHGPALEQRLHSAARRWGKGFLIGDGLGYRFDGPAALTWLDDGVRLRHDCGPLQLHVERRVGDAWAESYELLNPSGRTVTVGSLAVSTPWRDVYRSSHDSLTNAVHAHVWTGGADSWVWRCRWTDRRRVSVCRSPRVSCGRTRSSRGTT